MSNSNVSTLRKPVTKGKELAPLADDTLSVRLSKMCEMIGVSETKGKELIRTGRVQSVKLGKTRLITVRSIKALLGEAA